MIRLGQRPSMTSDSTALDGIPLHASGLMRERSTSSSESAIFMLVMISGGSSDDFWSCHVPFCRHEVAVPARTRGESSSAFEPSAG